MAVHVWTVLCRRAVIDKYTNTISLHEVIEQLNVTRVVELPPAKEGLGARLAVPVDFAVATLWTRSDEEVPEEVEVAYQVQTPAGTSREFASITATMTEHLRTRCVITVQGLTFEGAGTYFIKVVPEGADEPAGIVPLQVVDRREDDAEALVSE